MAEPIVPTQADRIGAAGVFRAVWGNCLGVDFILSGERDEESLVQAFARHAVDARRDAAAEILALQSRLGEAERVIAPFAGALTEWGDDESGGNRDVYEHPISMLVLLDHFRAAARFINCQAGEKEGRDG